MRPGAPCFEDRDGHAQLRPHEPAQAHGAPLRAAALAAAPPSMQKRMIGERLFLAVARHRAELAGKLTGTMLELDNRELRALLESEQHL
eukprot:308623-Lingulodinium_polyedra.AAC.1